MKQLPETEIGWCLMRLWYKGNNRKWARRRAKLAFDLESDLANAKDDVVNEVNPVNPMVEINKGE